MTIYGKIVDNIHKRLLIKGYHTSKKKSNMWTCAVTL